MYRRNRKTGGTFRIPYRPMYPNSLSSRIYDLDDKTWVQSTPHPHVGRPTILELNEYRRKKGLKPLTLREVRNQSREVRLSLLRYVLRKGDEGEAYFEVGTNILDDPTETQIQKVLRKQKAILPRNRTRDEEDLEYFRHVNSGKFDPRFD